MSVDGVSEQKFKLALGMCQMLLRNQMPANSTVLPPDAIHNTVEEVVVLAACSGVDKNRLIKVLEERFTVQAPIHRTLGSNDQHIAWFHQKRGQIQWRRWDRYQLYLGEQISDSVIKSHEDVVDDILARLEDPDDLSGREVWDRRGLVMGHVQSGKTANYCGLICKAADAGYKVIIVLSGIHSSLRSQTQIRLDEGFLGFMSEPGGGESPQAFHPVGVGLIDSSVRANTATNRSQKGDFHRASANRFGINPGGLPLLFVVKKNATVLGHLLKWIRSYTDGSDSQVDRHYIKNVPALIVDDEADLASIDTRQQTFDENNNPDLDHDPTKINQLIRKILRHFGKVAYVGYTATPFANIFIHERGFTSELGEDLFPRSFIVNIPPPTNYMGPKRLFGIAGDDIAGQEEVEQLPLLRPILDHAASEAVDEEHGWMPPKLVRRTEHQPLYNGENCVPPSLREAMMAFILATSVRRIRESGPLYNSMLVHVTRFTEVQRLVSKQIEIALREILRRLQYGDGDRLPSIEDEFKSLWDRDFIPASQKCRQTLGETEVPATPNWDEVLAFLYEVTASIRVKTINGTAKDVLDYLEHRTTGMNVIAIGGDKLSRGLTLEGLSVSYFLRSSKMYDTLMQMGRWFGYRVGYIDLCRLYSTTELLGWFADIALASEELQVEFKNMDQIGGTPRDYGLKIRSHPIMLVTSAVKMRHGSQMRCSFSGSVSETIKFHRNPDWIARNFSAVDKWLASLGRPSAGTRIGGYTWKDVPAQKVIDFLHSYSTHEVFRLADAGLFIKYINAQLPHNELEKWIVRLCSSGAANAQVAELNGLNIGLIKRTPFPKEQQKDSYGIRQLVSPSDELAYLNDEQRKEALRLTVERWREDPERKSEDVPPTKPGREEARKARGTVSPIGIGLLLLYPLDQVHAGLDRTVKPVMGIALSFPKSDTAVEIAYTANNIFTSGGGDDESL